MADYDDVKISGLIINNLTQAKYDELLAAGKIDPNQIYCTEQGDYTTNEDFNSALGTINESIESLQTNKADKSDTYTKAEVDAKVSSVYRFMGSVATIDALPVDATVGDTYNVEADGSNYAWDGTAWDKLSETIDLTPYLTKSEASTTYETIENVGLHTNNKNNPHGVTKAQVGLGNVDNTSDLAKPISTATQNALDLKANQATTYSKTAVDDLLDKKLDSNTAASTYATIATVTGLENQIEGKLVIIDGQIEELTDTCNAANEHINNTNNPHGVTKAQVGLGNVDNTSDADKPISTATQTALDLKADKSTTYTKSQTDAAIKVVSDKVTTNTASITSLNQSVEALQSSKADATDLSSHTSNTSNPHSVTKAQVGLGNVDNTSDANKPISTATQAALDEKQNALTAGTGIKLETDTVSITDDVVTNQTQVTSGSFSVGNTTGKNTGSNSTHINSVRTINQAGAISIGHFAETDGAYGIGIGFSANAGYSSVGIGYSADAAAWYSVQLGDGTNNNEKTLQFRDYPLVDAEGNIYSDRLISNAVTKYLEMPSVSSKYNNIIVQYVGATTDEYTNGYFYKGSYIVANTYTVEENQVGFSISSIDANKLMDWFTKTVQPPTPLDFTKNFIIGVPDVGGYLELYYNYDENYGYAEYQATIYSMDSSEHGIEFTVDESLLYDVSEHTKLAEITISITDASWKQINVQPLQDLSGYAEKSTVQQIQQTLGTKADKSDTYTKAEVDAKVSSVYRFMGSVASVDALPAGATVGDTYNVENTGANYAWTGAAWDKLSETIDLTPYLTKENAVKTYETIENVNLHKNNTSNPHKVTAAQVGLGNVNNTADLDKPISTATQAALDGKQNTLTQAQLNAVNSGITAAKVSKYDNYATEIAGKQPAGDYATNTALSQGLDGKVDKNHGVASAGKVLAVNEQGVVEPTEIKAGGVNATYNEENHRITFA